MLGENDDGAPRVIDGLDDLLGDASSGHKVSNVNDTLEPDVTVIFQSGQKFVRDEVGVGLGVADERVVVLVLVFQIDGKQFTDARMCVQPDENAILVHETDDDGAERDQDEDDDGEDVGDDDASDVGAEDLLVVDGRDGDAAAAASERHVSEVCDHATVCLQKKTKFVNPISQFCSFISFHFQP